ncbi:MAG: nuclear transport factor 2 family protein [Bryobacteraceae bacterium]|jgi:ketosteroid isomerase-like protein
MSEQQNTGLIQKVYDAFSRGDLQTILNNLTEDVDWGFEAPHTIPYAGQRKGTAQVTKFFEALATTQSGQKLTPQTFVAQGDHVATLCRYSGTVTATEKKFDCPVAHFFTIRGGKVASFVNVTDSAAMVEAYVSSSAAAR